MTEPPKTMSRLGATAEDGRTRFVVWAPYAERVEVCLLDREIVMKPRVEGYHEVVVDDVGQGDRYGFRLDGGPVLPDPASRCQPDGMHELSEVVHSEPAVLPSDWSGIRVEELVLYELHVGTFTEAGTFDAVISQLGRLSALGVTAIELMPIAQFPGGRNWGYDGVYAFAAQNTYGGRSGLIRLVEAAHDAGIAVVLDVVHNHVGPEGNYLGSYGPYFTDRFSTVWGPSINMTEPGSDGVRRYFIDSAVEWITEVGIDGLRLDAVHAIIDQTAKPFLEELTEGVGRAAVAQGRQALVIAESSDNDPRYITPRASGGLGCDAVWNDDLHHGIRVALTGERPGYYADYAGVQDIVRCFEHGWVFTGQHSIARGRRHGRVLDGRVGLAAGVIPFNRLVVCDQNHDQIGNRAAGDRLDINVTVDQRRLAAATTVLGPFTPMLFMGEEYAESAPFPYFVSHTDPELIEVVRRGRASEFPENDQASVPDPASVKTFESAKLNPTLADEPAGASMVMLYTSMFEVRRENPVLTSVDAEQRVVEDRGVITVDRQLDDALSRLVLNYSAVPATIPVEHGWTVAVHSYPEGEEPEIGADFTLEPWTALLLLSTTPSVTR
jgi:maltooligosyltrehalose trehalohydrolase